MTNNNVLDNRYTMPKLSVGMKTLVAFIAIVCAVALPQLVHQIGITTGTGSSLGEVLLPMHFPVLLVGFVAGPVAGLATGLFAPIISFVLTGMPGILMLPFIVIELGVYGMVSGLIVNADINSYAKVFIAQIAGRGVRAVAILIAFFTLGSKVAPMVILTSVAIGISGIILQLIFIPAIMKLIAKAE